MSVIRTTSGYAREGRLYTIAARLRSDAEELEQLAGESGGSYMPPPPLEPKRLSFRQKSMHAVRTKRISLPAAGGWAAGITVLVEVLRMVLEHVGSH